MLVYSVHWKYAELLPSQLTELLANGAPLIWPWGALEWHGEHLPLGLDGIVAEEFGVRLAEKTGGILLPACWLPITTLPHTFSLQITTETLRRILDESLAGFAAAGATRVAIVSGHYAHGHLIELYEAAVRALSVLRVYCAAPLELLGNKQLDHAGRFETSQLLAIRPDLVNLGSLPRDLRAREHAVLGEHPNLGSAAEGDSLLNAAVDLWAEWMQSGEESMQTHYSAAIANYAAYRQEFGGESWEQAIIDWWVAKTSD